MANNLMQVWHHHPAGNIAHKPVRSSDCAELVRSVANREFGAGNWEWDDDRAVLSADSRNYITVYFLDGAW